MSKYITHIIIAVLLTLFILSYFHKKTEVVERVVIDTLTIVRYDTIKVRETHFVRDTVVDSIYIEKKSENGLKLPITQRFYQGSDYKAWVSGYRPSLDSIDVFGKTIVKDVITTVTKEVYPKTIDVYLNAGSLFINNDPAPYIGASLKLKNDIMVGANIGYFDKRMFYGLNIGFKLNKK